DGHSRLGGPRHFVSGLSLPFPTAKRTVEFGGFIEDSPHSGGERALPQRSHHRRKLETAVLGRVATAGKRRRGRGGRLGFFRWRPMDGQIFGGVTGQLLPLVEG
ncbi:hypothetical protein E2320_006401, partial [Naja naja]